MRSRPTRVCTVGRRRGSASEFRDAPTDATLIQLSLSVGARVRFGLAPRVAVDASAGVGAAWGRSAIDDPAGALVETSVAPFAFAGPALALFYGPGEAIVDLRWVELRFSESTRIAGNALGLDPSDPAGTDDFVKLSLTIPVHVPVVLRLRSKDVIHSFFSRELRVKQDAVPGLEVPLTFTATQEGRYEIACAELCGIGHYKMRSMLQVVSKDEFEKFLRENAP